MDKGWQASAVPSLRRPSADLDGGQYYILDESLTPQNDSLITVIEAKEQLIESLRLENERLTLQLQVKDEQIKNLQDERGVISQGEKPSAQCYAKMLRQQDAVRVRSHANS